MCDRGGYGCPMDLTAVRKHFQTSRATMFSGLRAWLEHLSDGAWTGTVRRRSEALLGALSTSLSCWRPLDTEYGRAVADRFSAVHGRCAEIALKAGDRCAPTLTKVYDRVAPFVENVTLGARRSLDRGAQSRELTRIVIVVALPALAFVCFAFARWVSADGPTTTAFTETPFAAGLLAGSNGASSVRDPLILISTTLVEPPALGGRMAGSAPPTAPFPPLEAKAHRQTEDSARNPRPDDMAAFASAFATRQAVLETPRAHASVPQVPSWTADEPQSAEDSGSAQVAALPTSLPETPSPNANVDDPGAHYLFNPRPRPSRDTEPSTHAPTARATPEPDISAGIGRTPETSYSVQLAAVRGRDQALNMWKRLSRAHSDLLGTLDPDVSTRTTRHKRLVYRLRAGPLNSKTEADNLCSALERRKVACLVIKADG